MQDIVAQLNPADQAAMQPETFANPAVQHVMGSIATLPQRAIENSQYSLDSGNYDPSVPVEAAMTMMGGAGAVPAEANTLRSGLGGSLFHGSERPNISFINPSQRGPLGPGVYTTPNESLARRYAGDGGTVYNVPADNLDIFNGAGHRTDAEYYGAKDDISRLVAAAPPDKQEAIAKIVDTMHLGDGYPLYKSLRNLYGSDEGAQGLFKSAGFHGLSGQVDGHEVLLFGPQSRPIGGVSP